METEEERKANRHRNREFILKEMAEMSDQSFRRMFRMSRVNFYKLLELIGPCMPVHNVQRAVNSSGSPITPVHKLGATLRWLAGGSYLDICTMFGISEGTFFNEERGPLWPTIEAIDATFNIGIPFRDVDALQGISDGFSRLSHGHLHGCVMAVDGWVIRTRAPNLAETEDIISFRNRHACWGIVVLAGCDSKTRYMMFNCFSTGSTNDILIWNASAVKQLVDEGRLPPDFFFIGDEAFQNTDQFLVPYGGHGLGPWKDAFNYLLSRMRQVIERSFGIMTARWGIFWRPFQFAFVKWTLVATVCAKLHNFCVDNEDVCPPHREPRDVAEDDEFLVYLNEHLNFHGRPLGDRRTIFTAKLQANLILRPPHAMMNNRV
jgi:hypothetical protein